MNDLMKQCAASGQMSARQIAEEMAESCVEAPAGELSEKQLNIIGSPWHFNLLVPKEKTDVFNFARAVIAADRALHRENPTAWAHASNEWADVATNGLQWLHNIRDGISTVENAVANMEVGIKHCVDVSTSVAALRASPAVGDVAMPVVAYLHDWQQDGNEAKDWISLQASNAYTAGSSNVRPLVKQAEAQAALAAKDAEIAELDRSETQLIGERDDALEYGAKLADAVSAFFRVPVGEYSNMNDPRDEALAVLGGAYITDSDQDRQIAALTAERDALHSVALEFDRLMLVIESAVRHSNPENHASVMALIRANRAAMTKEPK